MNNILLKEQKRVEKKIIKKERIDKIDKVENSIVQHGKLNDRVFLLNLNPKDDNDKVLLELDNLVEENSYSKIISIIRTDDLPYFVMNGYKVEAYIPKFFNGKYDCVMASKFFTKKRAEYPEKQLETFSGLLEDVEVDNNNKQLQNFKIEQLNETNVEEITEILKQIFTTYPFPIESSNILKGMQEGRLFYFGVWDRDKLVGLSGAEVDHKEKNAEMTDFAVLPKYRGKRFASYLLNLMEISLKKKNIKTAYAVARLSVLGMNKTFLNASYKYSGTLVNNTHIAGQIESMNIYYKHL
ncbi:MAG: putative beta-lysine N-acetyltransferase [Bacteroidales bacterium]|nr:putative beta-lysine N-acetyltransferase [Bacteroidales bacterium]NLB85649.1 putative beta-lysine N-acetyltransferase [Bacteroidales bacterium]